LIKSTGRTDLSVVQSYRDSQKKTGSKIIPSLGYLDALEKEYDFRETRMIRRRLRPSL
jgi:hypothetical protein